MSFTINKALSDRDLFMKLVFERENSFSQLLPYYEYLHSQEIFVLKDWSLGCVFEVDLIEHEHLSAERIVESVDYLKSLFNLPENCTLQVLFDQAYIPARDKIWESCLSHFKSPHPISAEIYKSRVELFKSYCEGRSSLSPMRRRTLISIRYFPNNQEKQQILSSLKKGEEILLDNVKNTISTLSDFSQILAEFTTATKLSLKRLKGEDLIDFLRQFFNPKEYLKRDFAPFNSSVPISDQAIFTSLQGSFDGLTREGVKTKTITLKTNPRRVIPGGMANFLNLNFPVKISLNFSFPSQNKTKGYFDMKEFFLQNTPSAKAKRQQKELKEIQDRLAHGERCLFMTFCVVVEAEDDETLMQRTRSVMSIFHNDLECEVIKEDLIGFGMCLNTLPLFYSPASDYSSQRYIHILNQDATRLLPVFDSYRGMNSPLQLYLSRENNLVQFSCLSNPISNHMVVLGDTGSGKSKLALDFLQSSKLQNPEPLIFVLDKRASCEAICKEFDGDLSVFNPHKEMPFSSFRGTFDDEKVTFLTQLLLAGVKLTNPSFEMESHHLSIVSRSLKEAYFRKARDKGVVYQDGILKEEDSDIDVSVGMDDVIASMSGLTAEPEFENLKDEIDDLITRLMPFYGDGVYAPFFRAPKKVKKKTNQKPKLLYAYDLEALDADPTLKTLMSMCVFQEAMSIMSKPENLKRGGLFCLEELGCLGKDNPIVEQYADEFAQRLRKLGFFLIGVAPSPTVFFETVAGRSLWRAAEHYFFLKMSPDNIRYLGEKSSLLDPVSLEIMGTLETNEERGAEVYYTNKNGTHKGAFRYIQTEVDRRTSVNSERDRLMLEKESKKEN